jgi:hypothetical protein
VFVIAFCATAFGWDSPKEIGTNGAGTTRKWETSGKNAGNTVMGTFLRVKNGVADIEVSTTTQTKVPIYDQKPSTIKRVGNAKIVEPGQVYVRKTETVENTFTKLHHIPLNMLSYDSRKWIEQQNPISCSLNSASKKGAVGTLAMDDGKFVVSKKLESEKAVVVAKFDNKEVRFILNAPVVSSLDEDKEYKTIDTGGQYDFVIDGTTDLDGEKVKVIKNTHQ